MDDIPRLTLSEAERLRAAMDVVKRNPEAAIKYLGKGNMDKRAIAALALSALLEIAKQKHELLKVSNAVLQFFNTAEKGESDDGQGEQASSHS